MYYNTHVVPHDSKSPDQLATGPILEVLHGLEHDWFMLGTYLTVPNAKLKEIDHRIKCKQCMVETLIDWIIHKEEEATLPALIAAVRGCIIDNEALAQQIETSPKIKEMFCWKEGMYVGVRDQKWT